MPCLRHSNHKVSRPLRKQTFALRKPYTSNDESLKRAISSGKPTPPSRATYTITALVGLEEKRQSLIVMIRCHCISSLRDCASWELTTVDRTASPLMCFRGRGLISATWSATRRLLFASAIARATLVSWRSSTGRPCSCVATRVVSSSAVALPHACRVWIVERIVTRPASKVSLCVLLGTWWTAVMSARNAAIVCDAACMSVSCYATTTTSSSTTRIGWPRIVASRGFALRTALLLVLLLVVAFAHLFVFVWLVSLGFGLWMISVVSLAFGGAKDIHAECLRRRLREDAIFHGLFVHRNTWPLNICE